MDADERRILSILSNTNKSIFDAQKSNNHRIKSIEGIVQASRVLQLKNASITPLNQPLDVLRDEIFKMLMFSREYTTILSNIDAINIYDAAEIIVEIGDVRRFKNKAHFLSYAGLAPIVKKNEIYSKVHKYSKGKIVANKKQDPIGYCENLKTVLMRCTKKIISSDNEYKSYYEDKYQYYKYKHPTYNSKHIYFMALKKTSIKFATFIYFNFKEIAILEEKEKINDYNNT